MYDNNNIYLICMNLEIALFQFLNNCQHYFKFHIKLVIYSVWLKDPNLPVQDLKLFLCWNELLERLLEELSSAIQFSNFNVFIGFFLISHPILRIELHQTIEQT